MTIQTLGMRTPPMPMTTGTATMSLPLTLEDREIFASRVSPSAQFAYRRADRADAAAFFAGVDDWAMQRLAEGEIPRWI
jgi:hypothetical protein